jgi:hypothetical protein
VAAVAVSDQGVGSFEGDLPGAVVVQGIGRPLVRQSRGARLVQPHRELAPFGPHAGHDYDSTAFAVLSDPGHGPPRAAPPLSMRSEEAGGTYHLEQGKTPRIAEGEYPR